MADPAPLPDWMSLSTATVTGADGVPVESVTLVVLPLTYFGPSIPLGDVWTYGGLTSPDPTARATSPDDSILTAATTDVASTTPTVFPSITPASISSTSFSPASSSSSVSSPTSSVTSIASSSSTSSFPTSDPTSAPSSTPSMVSAASSYGLSRGAIIGIVIVGVVVFLGLLLFGLIQFMKRTRKPAASYQAIEKGEKEAFLNRGVPAGDGSPGEGGPGSQTSHQTSGTPSNTEEGQIVAGERVNLSDLASGRAKRDSWITSLGLSVVFSPRRQRQRDSEADVGRAVLPSPGEETSEFTSMTPETAVVPERTLHNVHPQPLATFPSTSSATTSASAKQISEGRGADERGVMRRETRGLGTLPTYIPSPSDDFMSEAGSIHSLRPRSTSGGSAVILSPGLESPASHVYRALEPIDESPLSSESSISPPTRALPTSPVFPPARAGSSPVLPPPSPHPLKIPESKTADAVQTLSPVPWAGGLKDDWTPK